MTLIIGVALAILVNGNQSHDVAIFSTMGECLDANTVLIQQFVRTPVVESYYTECFAVEIVKNKVPKASEATR